jgi:hypothetical protein
MTKTETDNLMLEAYKIESHTSHNYEVNLSVKLNPSQDNYLKTILSISDRYLKEEFNEAELDEFYDRIKYIESLEDTERIIKEFSYQYIRFVK